MGVLFLRAEVRCASRSGRVTRQAKTADNIGIFRALHEVRRVFPKCFSRKFEAGPGAERGAGV